LYEAVQGAEFAHRSVDGALGLAGTCDIGANEAGVSSQGHSQSRSGLIVQIGDDYMRAGADQSRGTGLAQSAGAAGNEKSAGANFHLA
jgi:hypothetical protein